MLSMWHLLLMFVGEIFKSRVRPRTGRFADGKDSPSKCRSGRWGDCRIHLGNPCAPQCIFRADGNPGNRSCGSGLLVEYSSYFLTSIASKWNVFLCSGLGSIPKVPPNMPVLFNRSRFDSALFCKLALGTVFFFIALIVLGVLPFAIR
jgi:hypothetical protein